MTKETTTALLRGKLYGAFSKFLHLFFSPAQIKERFELLYWQLMKWKDPQLGNQHYEAFYTTYFGLNKAFYAGKKIIDIGCGPRGSLEWANTAKERVGLDPLVSQYLKLGATKHQMTYCQANAEAIPYPDNHFDVVTSFNSLDHVDNLDKVIAEIIRVLTPNGLFLLISDIHDNPTICEPSAFGWDICQRFTPQLQVVEEKHFEGHQLYKSIRKGIPFNHKEETKRYGVLTAKFVKLAIR